MDISGVLRADDGGCEDHGEVVSVHVSFHLILSSC